MPQLRCLPLVEAQCIEARQSSTGAYEAEGPWVRFSVLKTIERDGGRSCAGTAAGRSALIRQNST